MAGMIFPYMGISLHSTRDLTHQAEVLLHNLTTLLNQDVIVCTSVTIVLFVFPYKGGHEAILEREEGLYSNHY